MIADRLQQRARSGAYDQSDPRRFADLLTADLQSVNGDKHLSASYTPPGPANPAGAPPGRSAAQAETARRDHWGLPRTEVLPGNVGYMKVTSFEGSPAAIDATASALRFLESTDAMIFDFRGMNGGSGEQSNYLISHFTSPDTVPSLVISSRIQGTRTRYTLGKVPGTRRPAVPIWILTDRGTASAGEDFSFVLQQLGRARTVGDRTAGAGHNNMSSQLGLGFAASLSVTRVSDARTHKEWERVGVLPDVAVKPSDAMDVAYVAALDSLARAEKDAGARAQLSVIRDGAWASSDPHIVPATTLAALAGTYEGGRIIAVEGGRLTFRRDASRPPRGMVAVDDSTFVLGGNLRVRFERTRDGTNMVQQLADGSLFTTRRTGDVPGDLAP